MAELHTITIPIGGMNCQHCVASVTKALSETPGIVSVDVNLDKGQAVVSGESIDVTLVKKAIEDIGFDAGDPV